MHGERYDIICSGGSCGKQVNNHERDGGANSKNFQFKITGEDPRHCLVRGLATATSKKNATRCLKGSAGSSKKISKASTCSPKEISFQPLSTRLLAAAPTQPRPQRSESSSWRSRSSTSTCWTWTTRSCSLGVPSNNSRTSDNLLDFRATVKYLSQTLIFANYNPYI